MRKIHFLSISVLMMCCLFACKKVGNKPPPPPPTPDPLIVGKWKFVKMIDSIDDYNAGSHIVAVDTLIGSADLNNEVQFNKDGSFISILHDVLAGPSSSDTTKGTYKLSDAGLELLSNDPNLDYSLIINISSPSRTGDIPYPFIYGAPYIIPVTQLTSITLSVHEEFNINIYHGSQGAKLDGYYERQ